MRLTVWLLIAVGLGGFWYAVGWWIAEKLGELG
jgi:hypothetical protein